MSKVEQEPRPLNEAEVLLKEVGASKNFERFLDTASFPNAHNNTPTKLGFAARMLRVLRDYHSDATEIFGTSEENLKNMVILQEAFKPLTVKGLPTVSVKYYQSTSKPPLSQFKLSDDERVLCRALRTSIELFRRRFLVIKWGDDIKEDENLARYLELVRLTANKSRENPISREDFFNCAQVWFEMYAGARTRYAHPKATSIQADLEFLFDHQKTRDQKGESKRLFLNEGMETSLAHIREKYLGLGPAYSYTSFIREKILEQRQK